MKTLILLPIFFLSINLFAQQKIEKLKYAKTQIEIPDNCIAKSEYEIIDCNNFSVQWLYLNDEMIEQKINEQLFKQIEEQLDFKNKDNIKFLSQNQNFDGVKYEMKDGGYRIVGFGKIDNISLILNLGLKKNPKTNNDLTDFEKKFIKLK